MQVVRKVLVAGRPQSLYRHLPSLLDLAGMLGLGGTDTDPRGECSAGTSTRQSTTLFSVCMRCCGGMRIVGMHALFWDAL